MEQRHGGPRLSKVTCAESLKRTEAWCLSWEGSGVAGFRGLWSLPGAAVPQGQVQSEAGPG